MGRYRWDKKTTVEECRSLWAATFHKQGVFKFNVGYTSGTVTWRNHADEVTSSLGFNFSQQPSPRLTLFYNLTRSATGEQQDLRYDVELATTPCRYGGLRYWFICPLVKNDSPCRRRITKLYLPPSSTYYGCRHCYNLTYESCQEHDARVNHLAKNPELLAQMLNSGDLRGSLRALKAAFRLDKDLLL